MAGERGAARARRREGDALSALAMRTGEDDGERQRAEGATSSGAEAARAPAAVGRARPASRRTAIVVALAVFVIVAGAMTLWLASLPSIPDFDSYYHLAVARLYRAEGLVRGLAWARLSLLGERLGDKELLFHLALPPFATPLGGRVAVGLVDGAILGLVAWIGVRAAGPAAGLVPAWMLLSAVTLFTRMTRLRPELFSLFFLLAFTHAFARRRPVLVALLAAAFALSHTAFHLLLVLAALYVIVGRATEKRWDLGLFAAALGGVALGVAAHPHFPDNLHTFWVQNAVFFTKKQGLDVGEEFQPTNPFVFAWHHLGFLAGLVALWRARAGAPGKASRETWLFGAAAAIFVLPFAAMTRMATYFVPLTTLAVVLRVGDAGGLGPHVLLFRRDRVHLALALAIAVGLSAPATLKHALDAGSVDGGITTSEEDLAAFGKAVPDGARVVATWGAAEAYVFFAPQGRYLNLLDPIFMALPHPREHAAVRAIFDGSEPDVPFVAKELLGSDYVAGLADELSPTLLARLQGDPRTRLRYASRSVLVELVDDRDHAFVRDWMVADEAEPAAARACVEPATDEAARRAGFVDLARALPAASCAIATRREVLDAPAARTLELTPWGPGELVVDGETRARTEKALRAVLGRGPRVRLELAAGEHTMRVRTCRDAEGARSGFYLVRR
jgi:hypothetical protein